MNAIKDFYAVYRLKELEARKNFMQLDNEQNENNVIELSREGDAFLQYGKFDVRVIGEALACLLTVVEGREYDFHMQRHKYKRRPQLYGNQPVCFFNEEECETAYLYPTSMLDEQVAEALYRLDQSKLLIINTSKYSHFNLKDHTFHAFQIDSLMDEGYYCDVHCEQYPYVKEFLEMVFNYRVARGSLSITEEEISYLLNHFIRSMKKEDKAIIIR